MRVCVWSQIVSHWSGVKLCLVNLTRYSHCMFMATTSSKSSGSNSILHSMSQHVLNSMGPPFVILFCLFGCLLYTATMLPYRLAFIEFNIPEGLVSDDWWNALELVIDCLFVFDLVFCFFCTCTSCITEYWTWAGVSRCRHWISVFSRWISRITSSTVASTCGSQECPVWFEWERINANKDWATRNVFQAWQAECWDYERA